ncbi:hypothetical protein D1AOALGA4SA_9489 [Olavius algarvensis Delta 1 endosymbiont]|nr:hypothetical protein D1AOALGA4SA_9489 [Olavius algarvensis Delta 1 endosymbiont]
MAPRWGYTWAVENCAFFGIFDFKNDPSFIPDRFRIWDLMYSIDSIKLDRAKRYNKSAIQNPQSKITLKRWLNGIKLSES